MAAFVEQSSRYIEDIDEIVEDIEKELGGQYSFFKETEDFPLNDILPVRKSYQVVEHDPEDTYTLGLEADIENSSSVLYVYYPEEISEQLKQKIIEKSIREFDNLNFSEK